jgi:hypothetical protein
MNISVDLVAPTIDRWAEGNTGVPYVWTFTSSVTGPRVWVNVLTHGNEICGALVADDLLSGLVDGAWQPRRGSLTISFANVAAYARFDAENPFASRYVDEDFNRVWNSRLGANESTVELQRARALKHLADSTDYLLDIHSMLEASPPLTICGPHEKGIAFARAMRYPNWIISDAGHSNGTRLRDYGDFGNPGSPRNALLIECGQHWEHDAFAVAWRATWHFLELCGSFSTRECMAARDRQTSNPDHADGGRTRLVKVTDAIVARTSDFKFAKAFRGLEIVAKKGDLIAVDGDVEIVAPYDQCVLVMPLPNHATVGLTAVRLGQLIQ